MSDTLSSNAVIYAILALNSEVALQKEYLDSPDVLPAKRENEQGILDDLEQAFMEFVDFYKSCRKQDSSLPELDELLNSYTMLCAI
jgi:hypothetical protein